MPRAVGRRSAQVCLRRLDCDVHGGIGDSGNRVFRALRKWQIGIGILGDQVTLDQVEIRQSLGQLVDVPLGNHQVVARSRPM